MGEATIGILHPGEMGAAVGQSLVTGGHEVFWLPAGRSEATAARARAAGLTGAVGLAIWGTWDVAQMVNPNTVLIARPWERRQNRIEGI